jgi:excisionase family DNA binding protein
MARPKFANSLPALTPSADPLLASALRHNLDKRQLSVALNASVRTIDSWVHNKKIPCRKIGRMIRFDLDRVMAALDRYVIREVK